jgi:cytochrome c-type biogenesis protein
VIDANLTFAFTAGIVATVNPCGFAMLPAYLSYFLGIESGSKGGDTTASLGRALLTGAVVSSGFLVVFGIVGVLFTAGLDQIRDIVPWITIAIGAGLVVLGIALLSGKQLVVLLPKFERGGSGRDVRSLFLFGVSYAVASVSCGLPTFIVVVSTSVGDFQSSLASFVAYALGMALVLTSLTVSLAMARQSLLHRLRSLMQHVDRLAGGLMVLAGVYLIWYWVTERLGSEQGGVVLSVERWSSRMSNWVSDLGGVRLGVIMSIVVALAAMWALASGPGGQDPAPGEVV